MLKPKGYNVITLSDEIYCGRIFNGQEWRLLQSLKVEQAGQFRDMVGRAMVLATTSAQELVVFS